MLRLQSIQLPYQKQGLAIFPVLKHLTVGLRNCWFREYVRDWVVRCVIN
jgi:hypothetical protein